MNDWQERLRLAIERSGKRHSKIARAAKIAPETLSRLLHDPNASPRIQTLQRVAGAVGESVGWVLGERGFELSWYERKRLGEIAVTIRDLIGGGDEPTGKRSK